MAKRIIGLKAVRMGDLAADGGPSTTLTAIGDVYEGGAELSTEDPEKKEFRNEDGTVIFEDVKAGKTTIKFSISDVTPSLLSQLVGGTKSGTGDAEVWNLLDFPTGKEQTIEIDSKTGQTLVLNRVNVFGKLSGKIGGDAPMLIEITGTILKPEKVGVPIMTTKKTA